MSLSICGVENDTVDDLIHTSNKRLRQEETAENNDVVLPDLSEKYIDHINQAIKILKRVVYRKKRGKKKNSYSNSEAEQHVIFKVKLEKWYRVDPTSPAVQNSNDKASSQNTKPESSPKFNVIGGTTPAKHTASKKNWKCNTSYIRFVKFADLSSSKATNNDVSAENVQLTLSSFLRCTKDLLEKNDSLLACSDTKLTYLLKSSFTVNHTNVMVCQISQRSKHATAQVLPTLKFASRILQSTPDGMERLRAIGGKEGNRRDLLWVPSADQ